MSKFQLQWLARKESNSVKLVPAAQNCHRKPSHVAEVFRKAIYFIIIHWFIYIVTLSHCHIVLENAPWLCRSSEWPPWKWEVNRSKLKKRNRWGTAWSDVANTSLCRFAPPGHECYVPLHRAWMWRWCQWVHVPFRYTSTQKLDENISRNTTWNAKVKLLFLSKHRVCRYTYYTYTLKFQSLQYKIYIHDEILIILLLYTCEYIKLFY